MESNFRKNLLVSSGVSLLILLISTVASFISIRSLVKSNGLAQHTQDVLYNIAETKNLVLDAQNSVRAYIITGRQSFLAEYEDAEELTDNYIEQLENLTSDNPVQRQHIAQLKPVTAQFYGYLKARIADRATGKMATEADLRGGKKIMDKFRAALKKLEAEEEKLLETRTSISDKYGTYSTVLIILAAIISLIISGLFFNRTLKSFNQSLRLQRELKRSEQETAQRIKVISAIAGEISGGNYTTRVNDTETDALGSVAWSLNSMAQSLELSFKNLSDKEWLQTGIAELNKVMIGEKSLNQLTKDVIEYIAVYTGSSAGVIYLHDKGVLHYCAGYGYSHSAERDHYKAGDGLIGQAVHSDKILELKSVSDKNIKISYALGEVTPGHIVAVPLYDSKVTAVAELATIGSYTVREMEFFSAVANNIGIAITAAQNRERVSELLEETQAQSEELKAQHTELEGMNAELEAQTEKLQASEEELRVQQEELQQTNEELSERSVLLEEKNLEIQKKSEDLELTTRYKSEFLANMSHELRTPLNSILLLSRLLAENNEKNMNDEQVEFAEVIQSSGNGLLGLIDEILDLSKIEAGKMELELMEVSVNEISKDLHNLFSEVARQKSINFTIDDKGAPLVMRTDKMRLEQILKNLISNALKFTTQGSVNLTVKKHAVNDKLISFTVKDTGIGIPLEKQPLIFEAFQQADGSTKRKYGGTGLGLSISRELAKLLHGEITLTSTPGQGSEFTLTVPVTGMVTDLSTGNQATVQPAINSYTAPAVHQTETNTFDKKEESNNYLSAFIPEDVNDDRDTIIPGDKVILIVEDDINFAKSLLEFTRKRGYKGIVSVRGDYALNFALLYKPVGVLLDIQLPVKSGWEVMEELKNNPQTRHIPVHMMSSHKMKKESLLKGAVNFLDKPVAFEQMPEIFKRIEHIINKESQKVLIFEDNPKHAQALAYFLEANNINAEINSEINQGIDALHKNDTDCVILDMGIPDRQAYEVLENVKKNPGLENLPVIVFTGKSLSMKEELKIKKFADSIIVKTAHSYQRMLDEVSLFLHLVEDKKKGSAASDNKKFGQLNNVLSGKTVLVVDDDVRNIFSLTKALEVLKMDVVTAIDGREALKTLEDNSDIDVVLLDMMMPNMDGYETATRIRKNPKLKNLPVIAVTAKAMTGDREKCINAGASDYITKPVDVDQLLSLLRVWLYDRK